MMNPNTITGNKFYHLFFWLAIGGIWFYLRYQDYASLTQATQVTAIKVLDLAAMIYLVNLVLVPRVLYTKKYLLFALSFITLVALSSYLKMLLLSLVIGDTLRSVPVKEAVYNNFVTQFFLVLASIAIRSAVDYMGLQKRLIVMAKEKAEAELNFLKAQLNPHFLFNSLNAVYFLIDKENAAARAALHKFSEMLRYQLYECDGKKIPVEKEIHFLQGYADLQQLRTGNTTVGFNYEKDIGRFSIEPLLLIPFVENSFKHLSRFSDGKQNEVQIKLFHQKGSLHFSVYNTTESKTAGTKSGGIGLTNVQRRLALLYPGKHELELKQKDGWFGVELALSL